MQIPNLHVITRFRDQKLGCDKSMVENIRYCMKNTDDEYIITIDSDAIYNPGWIDKLISLKHELNQIGAITVFNTKIHPFIHHIDSDLGIKANIGGFASLINRKIFEDEIRIEAWDYSMGDYCRKYGLNLYCTIKSYVEHIGDVGFHSDGRRRFGDKALNFVGEI